MRKLKVYAWSGFRYTGQSGLSQTREIMAAYSAAEVRTIAGISGTAWAFSGTITTNAVAVEVAMSRPHIIFWVPANRLPHVASDFTPVEPRNEQEKNHG